MRQVKVTQAQLGQYHTAKALQAIIKQELSVFGSARSPVVHRYPNWEEFVICGAQSHMSNMRLAVLPLSFGFSSDRSLQRLHSLLNVLLYRVCLRVMYRLL